MLFLAADLRGDLENLRTPDHPNKARIQDVSRHTLSKTLLAVAITAASASAFAVTSDLNKDVSGATEVAYSRADFNNVTLSGKPIERQMRTEQGLKV